MQEEYEYKIEDLPKGTVISKKVGNNEYFYLKYRNGKKTVTDYIGRDISKVEDIVKQINKRRHFEKMLLELKKESKVIDKLAGGNL